MRLELPVQFVEKSGSETVVFLELGESAVAVRIDSRAGARFRPGESAAVFLPLRRINVFDAESGRRL
jgi:hypothetical protein